MKKSLVKARSDRRRKGEAFVDALHIDIQSELVRLRKLVVKFNLKKLHMSLLPSSANPNRMFMVDT